MTRAELAARTRRFALDVVKFCGGLPRGMEYQVISRQLLRAATSVGANYRSACRAKSRADFVHKLATVEEEADECCYWLELLSELEPRQQPELKRLLGEAGELTAIVVASRKTARKSAK